MTAESRTEVSGLQIGGPIGTPTLAWAPRRDTLRVGEIMSPEVVTATPDDTIVAVVQKMAEQNVSCVVITHKGRVAGILTEKDMLNTVAGVMSLPVVTIPAGCSILEAGKKMETTHFHRLFVADVQGVCGTVTQTDIMGAVRRPSETGESQQRTVQDELTDLLQRAIRDLQRVRDFLGGIPRPSSPAGGPARGAAPAVEETVSCAPSVSERS